MLEIKSGNPVTYADISGNTKRPTQDTGLCLFISQNWKKKDRTPRLIKLMVWTFKKGGPTFISCPATIPKSRDFRYLNQLITVVLSNIFSLINYLSSDFAQTSFTCSSFRDVIKGTRQMGSTSSKFSFFMFFTDFSQSSLSSSIQ